MASTCATTLEASNVAWPRKGPHATATPTTPYSTPQANPTTALSSALAICTRCLTGTHSSEVRTLLVAYSPVTVVIARTRKTNCTRMTEEGDALPTAWIGLSLTRPMEP